MACAVAALTFCIYSANDRSLNERARPLKKGLNEANATRLWESPTRYVTFRWLVRGQLGVSKTEEYAVATQVPSGAQTVLGPVSRMGFKTDSHEWEAARSKVSPDGVWRLWLGGYKSQEVVRLTRNQFPYTPVLTGPLPKPRFSYQTLSIAWRRDGRGWSLLTLSVEGYRLHHYRLGSPGPPEVVDLGFVPLKEPVLLALVGFSDRDNPVLYSANAITGKPQGFLEADEKARRVVSARPLRIPDGGQADVPWPTHLSPRGDRLAWVLSFSRKPWLSRVLPFVKQRPVQTEEVWTSRIDGTDFRRVGWVRALISGGHSDSAGLGDALDWSLDGKQILFTYKDDLYALPME